MRSAVLRVIKSDGIAGLYDGLTSSLLGVAVTNGSVLFFSLDTDVRLLIRFAATEYIISC